MVEPRLETRTIPLAYYHALDDRASLNLLMLLKKLRIFHFSFRSFIKMIWLALLLTSGCIRLERISTDTPSPVQPTIVETTQIISATSKPDYGWKDVSNLMEGVCFEAAMKVAGQVFKISDANALATFYAQINRDQACEDPVTPMTYPFSDGEMIVGLWSAGRGCTAQHIVQAIQRDDIQQQETIHLQFVTEGDCPYELLQPFWIAIPQSAGFNVQVDVQAAS
jgi:hypothetical protein